MLQKTPPGRNPFGDDRPSRIIGYVFIAFLAVLVICLFFVVRR